jgi:hypothetical protein
VIGLRLIWRAFICSEDFLTDNRHHWPVSRIVAVAVGAFVAFDLYALDGKYLHVAQTIAMTLRQHFLGF